VIKHLSTSLGPSKLTKSELSKRKILDRAPRPRLASTIVLIHGPRNNPKILMGKRSIKHDFMPSVYVFPGGRVDRCDSYVKYTGELSKRTEMILETAFTARKARALVLASIRETYEETALMIGKNESKNTTSKSIWNDFQKAGITPSLDGIEVFGRAITPPHRHKRFDAWFFIKNIKTPKVPDIFDTAELEDVAWFTLEQIWELNLQRATKMMLKVLEEYLNYKSPPPYIFFSRNESGKFITDTYPKA